MAHAYTVNVEPWAHGVTVRIRETGAGTSSEARIPLPTCGTVISVRSQLVSGTASVVRPGFGAKSGWVADSLDEIDRVPHSSAKVRDVRQVPFVAPGGVAWFRSAPDSGSDNEIVTEIIFDRRLIESRDMGLRAQLGRIRDSVEGQAGYDPSGILVSAVDTAGGVQVALSAAGGVATADPGTAVGWSVPLRDASGRPITSLGPFLLHGYVRALIKTAPTGLATPSNIYAYVGIAANGPLSTATKALVYSVENTTAGQWTVSHIRLASGTWSKSSLPSPAADITGVHGSWGVPNLGGGNTGMIVATSLPAPTIAGSRRDFTSQDLTGNDPHLIFGFGWAGVPAADDDMTARFLAKYLPTATET